MITLTSVGYGDEVSMPGVGFDEEHKYEWTAIS